MRLAPLAIVLALTVPASARSHHDQTARQRLRLSAPAPAPPPSAVDRISLTLSDVVEHAGHLGRHRWLWLSPALPFGSYGLSMRVDR